MDKQKAGAILPFVFSGSLRYGKHNARRRRLGEAGGFCATMRASFLNLEWRDMTASEPTLADWLASLPTREREHYEALVRLLQQVGDPEKLSADDRQELAKMAERFTGERASVSVRAPAPVAARTSAPTMQPISAAFLQTEFVAFVREVLNRDWCARGGTLQDAVLHAFEQKWLPDELRDEAACAQLYRRYQRDIDQANGFRQGLPGNESLAGDKRMAVGLAWFTTVYKMHQLLMQGVDPDS